MKIYFGYTKRLLHRWKLGIIYIEETIMSKNKILAVFALVFIICCWGYSWLVMKSVLAYIDPWTFTAVRCLFASATLFIILIIRKKTLAPPPLGAVFLVGLFQTCGMTGLGQFALVQGGAGNTAIFAYTMPFWLILLSALFLGEKISRVQFIAFIIAGIGFLLVVQPWEKDGSLFSTFIAIFSGLSWATGSILSKQFYKKQPTFDMLNFTAWQILIGAILLFPVAFIFQERPIVYSQELIFSFIYCAVLATGMSWTLWMFVLNNLSTSVSGISMLFVPVLSVILAWLFLGETPNTMKVVGVSLIVFALLLTTGVVFSPRRKM